MKIFASVLVTGMFSKKENDNQENSQYCTHMKLTESDTIEIKSKDYEKIHEENL